MTSKRVVRSNSFFKWSRPPLTFFPRKPSIISLVIGCPSDMSSWTPPRHRRLGAGRLAVATCRLLPIMRGRQSLAVAAWPLAAARPLTAGRDRKNIKQKPIKQKKKYPDRRISPKRRYARASSFPTRRWPQKRDIGMSLLMLLSSSSTPRCRSAAP